MYEAYKQGIDGVESWYDYEFKAKWKPSILICDSIASYANYLGIHSTCGTDTHGYSLLKR